MTYINESTDCRWLVNVLRFFFAISSCDFARYNFLKMSFLFFSFFFFYFFFLFFIFPFTEKKSVCTTFMYSMMCFVSILASISSPQASNISLCSRCLKLRLQERKGVRRKYTPILLASACGAC